MSAMATGKRIGTRIRRAMERKRLDQAALASQLGVSRSAVNAWINDRAYPRNAIGALEDVLGVSLGGDGEEAGDGLPALVSANRDDPVVMEIWSMKTLPPAAKEFLIAAHLEREGILPRRGERNG